MEKIRILIVDDSVVVRQRVGTLLASDPGLELAGTAANGRLALDKLAALKPDLILLDLEMPELDGLQTLAAIRREHPVLPVLIFSQHTQHGATATLEALAQGANDYVFKPEPTMHSPEALEQVREQLVGKIKALFLPKKARPSSSGLPAPRAFPERTFLPRIEVVVVGVSTGGPNALAALVPGLGAGLPVPLLIVQHMPPLFTKLLSQRLAGQSAMPVLEATDDKLVPGQALICPGDFHVALTRHGGQAQSVLTQGPPENSCRPSVDVLFRSAAAAYGSGVLGVILTGMGQDGLEGCRHIREAGGQVLVQDEASSVVWGMPGVVARAGLADRVLPLSEMAAEILSRVRRGRTPSNVSLMSARR